MDNCFSSKLDVRGSGFFTYFYDLKFQKIMQDIKNKTANVNKSNKEAFRNVCRDLSKYLINNKFPPPHYISLKDKWEGALKKWLQSYYETIKIHKECPVVLEENDMKILELKYDEEDFCEKRNTYLNEIRQLKPGTLKTCNEEYLKKCNEYKDWINERKEHFDKKVSPIKSCYRKELIMGKRGKKQESLCNILIEETFRTSSDCALIDQNPTCKNLQEKKKEDLQESQKTAEYPSKPEVQIEQFSYTLQEVITKDSHKSPTTEKTSQEIQPQLQDKLETEAPNPQDKSKESEAIQTTQDKISETQIHDTDDDAVLTGPNSPTISDSAMSPETQSPKSHALKAEPSIPFAPSASFAEPPKISGLFKKKKKIKRRPVKFLRILYPLVSWKKGEFLAHDHLENTLYDNEETIKRIKIKEHNMNYNVNATTPRKDTYKTIIEVHMEVLEKYRNEEWKHKKEEFIKIFLELFTEEEYPTYPDITNDELIEEDTKSINDIEKQKLLWNKFKKEHENISEKLKNTVWFNNLKNDWKKEQDNFKKKELKRKISDRNLTIPYLEKEKDMWRMWISKNSIIIKQYIEQNLFNYLTDELQNISDKYEYEETKDNFLLINIGELTNRKGYQQLYNYIKKQLLKKLCIFVLILVLEECKKEQEFENRETYLDSSISAYMEGKKSDGKPDSIENMSEFNVNVLENKEYLGYTVDDGFSIEIENWVG
ncbi:STP1 protein [Plasmodium malariae]|uniref:STP1 protein n=2 Tax=Plasmodium malariae TaxID=5858 RepID=A0A1D3PB57_PLAMA|nr:STP1 protein [Plasmodium malariae]SCN12486.1 STP1 protein [Plasmodium malariae]